MQYRDILILKSIVYLKFKFNWVSYVLSGNPTGDAGSNKELQKEDAGERIQERTAQNMAVMVYVDGTMWGAGHPDKNRSGGQGGGGRDLHGLEERKASRGRSRWFHF